MDMGEVCDRYGRPRTLVLVDEFGELDLPPGWRAVAASGDAGESVNSAMALWNAELLRSLPTFREKFSERLVDVRLCMDRDALALLYVARHDNGTDLVHWLGVDPRLDAAVEPVFARTLPPAVRYFLRNVHGGFTSPDCDSYGFVRPSHMDTFAGWAGFDGPIPGWDEDAAIGSTRLMVVTKDSGLLYYCTTPDRPANTMVLVFEGDVDDRHEFHTAMDELLCEHFSE